MPVHFLLVQCFLFIGFDLNLPQDEYGADDFDYVQNLAGKINLPYFFKVNFARNQNRWI